MAAKLSPQAPAIIVQDAFSSGGAGANNENNAHTVDISDDFDFNVGRKHQMRVTAGLARSEGGPRHAPTALPAATLARTPGPQAPSAATWN